MPTFVICAELDSPELQARVEKTFPGNGHFVLRPNSQWLVDAEKTSQEVSDTLELGEGREDEIAVVLLFTHHWGYHKKSLWEWMELD